MSGERGEVNAWRCPDCGRSTVAVHVDDGVTPFLLGCRATEGCRGRAVSAMYRPTADERASVAWEWYRPSERWARRKGPEMLDHVRMGGLAIRTRGGDR